MLFLFLLLLLLLLMMLLFSINISNTRLLTLALFFPSLFPLLIQIVGA
jgi:hypothetical protein